MSLLHKTHRRKEVRRALGWHGVLTLVRRIALDLQVIDDFTEFAVNFVLDAFGMFSIKRLSIKT